MADEQLTPEQQQEARLNEEAQKLGITVEKLKERIVTVNNTSNTFGQLALQITEGDWDMALSIAGTFLASTIAQTALKAGKTPEQLWETVGPGVLDTSRVLHAAFAEADELQAAAMADDVGKTIEGEARVVEPTYDFANGADVPKVG